MSTPFTRAPHQGVLAPSATHAALLIDFDNVTMGMRSDLSKDLKKLLQSDIIKGKVTVQRAYADWRRYPQYIVPLSEASIDLIFAPAYGSNKKNATDIRMAIDGMELVFTRPEIATFILLTGDSDFSSLVLKLKEYGKYVIGVGIQESSSDILVQNCDEYYSYTSLTGLRKTNDSERTAVDPWVLVEKAINRMAERDDVMRSDRLKQVMIEMDANFDEGDFGYSKFSRFLSEAATKGLVRLTKLENGQYEVGPAGGGGSGDGRRRSEGREGRGRDREGRGRGGRGGREREGRPERERPDGEERGERPESQERGERPERQERTERPEAPEPMEPSSEVRAAEPAVSDAGGRGPRQGRTAEPGSDPLAAAYDLLRRAMEALRDQGRESIRDSDVKRKMLELDGAFDETELGFGKFSRFLRQAHDHEVVTLQKQEGGNYEVSLSAGRAASAPPPRDERPTTERDAAIAKAAEEKSRLVVQTDATPAVDAPPRQTQETLVTPPPRTGGAGLGPRRGSTRRRQEQPEPSLFEGQVAPGASVASPSGSSPHGAVDEGSRQAASGPFDLQQLGLPTEAEAQIRYLTNYRGVGRKTAEALVEGFGERLFEVLQNEPLRLETVVPPNRAEQILEAWREDYQRRSGRAPSHPVAEAPSPDAEGASNSADGAGVARRRTRRGGRRGGRDRAS